MAHTGLGQRATAARIANYLMDIGHERLGVIVGVTQNNDRAADRLVGFTQALKQRGIDLPPQYVYERPYTVPEARRAMAALLRLPEPPTAVMCGNDILAYGALQECLWQNLKVPEQMSITGFDNIEMAAHCRPSITTMHVPACRRRVRTKTEPIPLSLPAQCHAARKHRAYAVQWLGLALVVLSGGSC